MDFWEVLIRSGQPFTFRSANQNGRLHISQATLGDGSSPKKSVLQCNVGNNAPLLLCSLLPNRLESCSLNLEFQEEEVVVFSVLGPSSIHLSGYHIGYHLDSYGENIDIESEADEESSYYDSEDECDDFIVDDDEPLEFDTSPKHVRGVKIKEIIDDEETKKVNDGSKLQKRQPCPTAERKFLTLEVSSEDEDGLFISAGRRNNLSEVVEANENLDWQLKEENAGEKPANDEKCHSTGSKRKSDALALYKNQNKKKDSFEKGLENSRKSKKKKEKGMMKEDPGSRPDMPVVNASNNDSNAGDGEHGNTPVSKSAADCNILEVQEVKKKKKKKKKSIAETDQNIDTDQSKVASSGNKGELEDHADGPPRKEAGTFPNGLIIEEISMGKPDGKRASPGMKVSIHYIGKLKKNGSIFDSSVGWKPFKFFLGVGEVIKGLDVGINGMRVGDKRRLTIPPSMGYGSAGIGKIPGNAWLVFDVELVLLSTSCVRDVILDRLKSLPLHALDAMRRKIFMRPCSIYTKPCTNRTKGSLIDMMRPKIENLPRDRMPDNVARALRVASLSMTLKNENFYITLPKFFYVPHKIEPLENEILKAIWSVSKLPFVKVKELLLLLELDANSGIHFGRTKIRNLLKECLFQCDELEIPQAILKVISSISSYWRETSIT